MLRRAMKAKQTGFTLIELMFTIVVLAVLFGIGVPNFRDFIRNSRMTAAANDFVTDFNVARTEAVKRRVAVTVCKSQLGAVCDANNADPFNSWIIFVDDANAAVAAGTDGNGVVDTGEIVLRQRQIPTSITVTADGRRTIFLPSGFPRTAVSGTDLTQIRLCDSRGNVITAGGQSAARAVTLSATGRPSATRDKAKITSMGGC
jgi:type IV fimbrial biogenesis protein FimT